jgi:hypothetical protein
LSSTVIQDAADYENYVRVASALPATFADGGQVQTEMQAAETYEPTQLARGAVAYSAVLALQDPTFVATIKDYAKNPEGRAQLVNLIYSNPSYAGQLNGAQSAATLIVTKLTADGDALTKAGAAIKQAAYDVQHQKWSKDAVNNPTGRLALAKELGAKPMTPADGEGAVLLQAAVSGSGLSVTPATTAVQPPYTEGVMRGLAIAALAVLGAAGDDNNAQVTALLDETNGPGCLNMAKLNHYQCLAVSRPHYEDMFCMGQHQLMDTGRCVQKIAGTAPPEVIETKVVAEPEHVKPSKHAKHRKRHHA